jgi:hypothetical protein
MTQDKQGRQCTYKATRGSILANIVQVGKQMLPILNACL